LAHSLSGVKSTVFASGNIKVFGNFFTNNLEKSDQRPRMEVMGKADVTFMSKAETLGVSNKLNHHVVKYG
jgi:hypothetical protein